MAVYFVKTAAIVATPSDSNDGRCPIGFALSGASFNNGTLRLQKTGAFTSYTWQSGDIFYVSSGTGVTPGLYEIVAKISNDEIQLASDIGGSNPTDVTSGDGPWLTISKGINTATAANDELRICNDGTYSPALGISFPAAAGTQNNPILIISATTRGVRDGVNRITISAASIGASTDLFSLGASAGVVSHNWHGFRVTGGGGGRDLFAQSTNGGCAIRFKNCRIDSSGSDGFQSINTSISNDIQFIDCEIDSNAGNGTQINNSGRGAFRYIRCAIHHNGGQGVRSGANHADMEDCLVYANASDGYSCDASKPGRVVNSIFFGNGGSGLRFGQSTSAQCAIRFANCIFAGNGAFGIDDLEVTNAFMTMEVEFCCFAGNASGHIRKLSDSAFEALDGDYGADGEVYGESNVFADPGFVSVTDGSEDFNLQADSPCLGVGTPTNRDIGRYQAVGGGGGGGTTIVASQARTISSRRSRNSRR